MFRCLFVCCCFVLGFIFGSWRGGDKYDLYIFVLPLLLYNFDIIQWVHILSRLFVYPSVYATTFDDNVTSQFLFCFVCCCGIVISWWSIPHACFSSYWYFSKFQCNCNAMDINKCKTIESIFSVIAQALVSKNYSYKS